MLLNPIEILIVDLVSIIGRNTEFNISQHHSSARFYLKGHAMRHPLSRLRLLETIVMSNKSRIPLSASYLDLKLKHRFIS